MTLTDQIAEPAHVTEGPSHPDPYPYYARLARGPGLFHDPALGCWVAASAAVVREVLESPHCLTRPAVGRIPPEIAGGAMAELFGRLVRLIDGPAHAAQKPAVAAAVRGVDLAHAAAVTQARADSLAAELGGLGDAARVHRFLFALPVQVLMTLLGLPETLFDAAAGWIGDYAAAAAAVVTGVPAPSPDLIDRGHAGAGAILAAMSQAAGPLSQALMESGDGCDPADLRANAAGLLVQGFASVSAVAGLALLRLGRDPALRDRVTADRAALRRLIGEILRTDSSTHSTPRFLARDAVIAGHNLREGERIIVMLAAASLDPALNPDPERFDIDRVEPRTFEFGRGVHACPADRLAPLIAEIAVRRVLEGGLPPARLEAALSYGASAHIRTPRFA